MGIVDRGPNFVFKKLKLFSAAALRILELFRYIFKNDSIFQIDLLYSFEIKCFTYTKIKIKQNLCMIRSFCCFPISICRK